MLTETVSFLFGLMALVSMAVVLYIHRTVLLGFTLVCFCLIASASLSGFLFGFIFGLDASWITQNRLWVFMYSSLGLTAFSLGVWLAWKPLRRQVKSAPKSKKSSRVGNYLATTPVMPWLNSNLVLLCLTLATAAYLVAPFIYGIPTLTAVWSSYLELLKFGVIIALVVAKTKGTYQPVVIAIIVYLPLVMVQALLTGFIGAAGTLLFQILIIWCFWNGLRVRSVLAFTVGMILVVGVAFSWLSSRGLIRRGELVSETSQGRAVEFLNESKLVNPLAMTPDDIQERIAYRFDMSDILAEQVAYQPTTVAYEYGVGTASDIVIILVPRFLWPDKPTRAGGSEYVSKYTGLQWADTSVDLPIQFHLYANGGAPFVVVGLFICGFLISKLELSLFNPNLSFPKFLGSFFVLTALGDGGNRFEILIMTVVAGYASYYLLGKILLPLNARHWRFWNSSEAASSKERRPDAVGSLSPAHLPQHS